MRTNFQVTLGLEATCKHFTQAIHMCFTFCQSDAHLQNAGNFCTRLDEEGMQALNVYATIRIFAYFQGIAWVAGQQVADVLIVDF